MRIVFVRHGQTTSNVAGALDTEAPGADLTDLGREQAEALVDVLREEPIEALHVSVLVRTQQTVAPLAAALGLEPKVHQGIREIRAGELEMRTDEPSIKTYLETVLAWTRGELDVRMPGAESGAEVLRVFDAVVAEILASGVQTAAVISHGAMIRCWTACRAANIGTDFVARNPLGNTGVVVLEQDGDGVWQVLSWEGRAVGAEDESPAGTEGPAAEPVP